MKNSFAPIASAGFFGGAVGLVGGLVLSIVIYGILIVTSIVSGASVNEMPPAQFVLFLGMGCGSLVGAIFGAASGMKK